MISIIIQACQLHYGMSVEHIELVYNKWKSYVFKIISNSNSYIVKISIDKKIIYASIVQNDLSAFIVNTPRVISSNTDSPYVKYNEYWLFLQEYIEGHLLEELSINEIEAKVNDLAFSLFVVHRYLNMATNFALKNLNAINKGCILLRNKECVYIHGDLHLGNIILNNNNFYIIDYDDVVISTYEYEFAMFIIDILVLYDNNMLQVVKFINNFLNCYESLSHIVIDRLYVIDLIEKLELFYHDKYLKFSGQNNSWIDKFLSIYPINSKNILLKHGFIS